MANASAPSSSFQAIPVSGSPAHFSTLLPAMISLKGQILQDLHTHLSKLLQLNPSRREAIAQYLDQLGRLSPGPSLVAGNADSIGGLRRWLEGPRSPAQNSALHAYFEEVALVVLGQAVLLKSWSDAGIRRWSESDLGRLNWALSQALKPHIPVDREGWQLTRPNLYSWYNPNPFIQHEIWATLESWNLAEDGRSVMASLLGPTRQSLPTPDRFVPHGYDPRFYQALWDATRSLASSNGSGNLSGSTSFWPRERTFFSPTLRDGSIVRTGPRGTWIGLECNPYQLMIAELLQLALGPSAPPLWAQGSGLEVHSRDQLNLNILSRGASPKPSLLSRITEMEACDVAIVLEERALRAQGRSPEAARFREQLEQLPYFRKLRAPGTSLGDLQSCVALGKLRPGGLLWWAREEPLGSGDGAEVLGFILERARILCQCDLSELEHQLPVSLPLFPRYLYLLSRESKIQERLTHRPLLVSMRGQIRSHVEVPLVLEDVLKACSSPMRGAGFEPPSRGQWHIHVQKSPTCQKEWADRWPDPQSIGVIQALDRLRQTSAPLASFATIRPTPEGDSARGGAWFVHEALTGFWIRVESKGTEVPASHVGLGAGPFLRDDSSRAGRRLVIQKLPRLGSEAQGTGFLILLPDESWCAPLWAYLTSGRVREWLDQTTERRADRWVLEEQVVRWIPVPNALLERLRSGALPALPPELSNEELHWHSLAHEIYQDPTRVREALAKLPPSDQAPWVRDLLATFFIQATRGVASLSTGQGNLTGVISDDGRVDWKRLFDLLPPGECVGVALHSRVELGGNLPPHIPIGRIDRIKGPEPGILLASEMGPFLKISSDSTLLLDMVMNQLEGVVHPTWSELSKHLRLPRRLELAEATARDLLRLHGEQSRRLQEFQSLLAACTFF